MRYFISIIVFLCSFSSFAKTQDIAAIVNDRAITMYEFLARKKMLVALNNIDTSTKALDSRLSKDVINILVEEELLNQHAEKAGIKISKAEIDNAISIIEERNKMPKGYMLQYMQHLGINLESFRKQIKGELIKYNIINLLSSSVSISPKELDVAVINSGFKDFDIKLWMFTALDGSDKTLGQMQKLKKRSPNCSSIDEKSYVDFATAKELDTKLGNLENKTQSVILDTNEESFSNVYQEDEQFKMVLVCKKKASVSGDDINKVKHFLSNQQMSKKATKFFKDLKARAYIKTLVE